MGTLELAAIQPMDEEGEGEFVEAIEGQILGIRGSCLGQQLLEVGNLFDEQVAGDTLELFVGGTGIKD